MRDQAICAQKSRYCWPDDAANASTFQAIEGPELLQPGDALLATVRQQNGELWQLWNAKRQQHAVIDVEFSQATLSSWGALHGAILRAMPLLANIPQLDWRGARGARALRLRSVAPTHLDGESFGLAFALSRVSEWLDIAPPADFIALAALDTQGRTHAVDGLQAKCECVQGWALGVRRILVTPEQEDEARTWTDREVVSVATLDEAVTTIYPDALQVLRTRWSADRAVAEKAIDAFYSQALNEHVALSSWQALATSCEVLADVVRNDDRGRHGNAWFARMIARRHENINDDPTAMIEGSRPPEHRSVRLTTLAHILQSVGDYSGDSLCEFDVEALVAKALLDIHPAPDRADEDLVLLGAAGRCLAGIRPERACDLSREACQGWLDQHKADQNSRALSEWLRLAGLLGRAEEVKLAVERHLKALEQHPKRDSVSVAFARLAAGGAYVKLNEPKAALEYLDASRDAGHEPEYLCFERARWRARALDALGDDLQAASERAKLETLVEALLDSPNSREPAVLRVNLALAQLDHALHTGGDTTACLAVIETLPAESRWMARLRRHCPAGISEARWIADAMPY